MAGIGNAGATVGLPLVSNCYAQTRDQASPIGRATASSVHATAQFQLLVGGLWCGLRGCGLCDAALGGPFAELHSIPSLTFGDDIIATRAKVDDVFAMCLREWR